MVNILCEQEHISQGLQSHGDMQDKEEEEDGEKEEEMYAVRRWRRERREGRGLLVGLLVVMERPEEEKVDGWREGGKEGRKRRWRRRRGLDDKRKIQTGQSFLFANRAPDKDSACSGADRGAISLPYSPLLSSIRPPRSPSR